MRLRPYLVGHLLEDSAVKYTEKEAAKQKERSITYAELYEDSLKMKGLLIALGIKKGDRVGILLNKSIEQLISMFGISLAGGIFVFLNPILKKNQIDHIISDCDIKLLITTGKIFQAKSIDKQNQVLFMDGTKIETFHPVWQQVKTSLSCDNSRIEQISDDTACLIYTSGSTGLPKGVVIPHRTLVDGAKIVSDYLGILHTDRLISVLPFNFDYGLNQATSSILCGATLVMHHFFLPNDLLRVLREEKITGFAGMIPIWTKLFNEKYGVKSRQHLPDLRYITNTGGKVPRSIVDKMRDFFPGTAIYLMYGLTEAFRSTYLPPEELDRRPDSMGKAIPNVEIMVINKDGLECAPGEHGELLHRGALVTKGYWNDPEKTKAVFRKNPLSGDQEHLDDRVVYSGDIVKKDEQGFLYFVSRRDEMIKTSGYRISPTEIEEGLVAIPDVAGAVVFSRSMQSGDQNIVAVLETSSREIEKAGVLKACRKTLPAYMVPHEIYFENEFKKTANDKIDRASIKQKWIEKGPSSEPSKRA